MMCIREEMNEWKHEKSGLNYKFNPKLLRFISIWFLNFQNYKDLPTKYKIPNLYLIDQFIFLNFKFAIPFRLESKSLGTN